MVGGVNWWRGVVMRAGGGAKGADCSGRGQSLEESGERGRVWALSEEVMTELLRCAGFGQDAGVIARMLSLVFWVLIAALGHGYSI